MPYQPPVRDFRFLFQDLLQLERYQNLPAFADAQPDVVDQILEEAARFTGEVLAPLNSVGDKEGCHWHPDFSVTTPTGFKAAYIQLVEGGWPGLGSLPEYGGQGLPHVVNLAFSEMSSAAEASRRLRASSPCSRGDSLSGASRARPFYGFILSLPA